MGEGHSHIPTGELNERNLKIALALTSTYLLAEIIGAFVTGSLALLSDAAHMLTDVAALAIALVAIQIAKRPADTNRTYGYYRFEILAAALNASVLFLVALYILYEAYQRFQDPREVESMGMLVVAGVGLIVNFISLRLLQSGSEGNLNMKGAYLEAWSDMLGSVGVIIAALLIRFTGWGWVDPLVAVGIGLWVLPRTWLLLKQSVNILLEGVPEGIELAQIEEALKSIPGVTGVHDLHVWAITSGKVSLTAHLLIDASKQEGDQVIKQAIKYLEEQFHITHSTIQIELENCQIGDASCNLEENHTHER